MTANWPQNTLSNSVCNAYLTSSAAFTFPSESVCFLAPAAWTKRTVKPNSKDFKLVYAQSFVIFYHVWNLLSSVNKTKINNILVKGILIILYYSLLENNAN